MPVKIGEILDYLDTHPVLCYEGDAQSLLEMLYGVYCAHTGGGENSTALVLARNREAFYQGIAVGIHLFSELNSLP